MSVTKKLLEASGGGGESTYVDDVFQTTLTEGLGNETIVNGMDLADKGALIWQKSRIQASSHYLYDSERGAGQVLNSNTDYGEQNFGTSGVQSWNADGWTAGSGGSSSGNTTAQWVFAKQEGFFDIVTYTGNGVAGRTVPHNLGSVPGMIIVKCTTLSYNWMVYHQSLGNTNYLRLNETTQTLATAGAWNNTTPTDSEFTLGNASVTNGNGESFVAYVFAHDAQEFGPDGDESIIKCGTYTTSVGAASVDLGWEPQWLLVKGSSNTSSWEMYDNMRGWSPTGSTSKRLWANESDAEYNGTDVALTATGFDVNNQPSPATYIYMAIRRPHKPAEEFAATDLFATDNAGPADPYQLHSGFPVDMAWRKYAGGTDPNYLSARLIQGKTLVTNDTSAATTNSGSTFDFMEGWYTGGAGTGTHSWMFRRAPGYFDVVAYTGDGQAGRQVLHNLSAVPEMMWVKRRDGVGIWQVYTSSMGATDVIQLDVSGGSFASASYWNNTSPTSSLFTVGSASTINVNTGKFLAYLWASVPGICDIGSYVADYTETTIDCGFTNGARFVLIKRTDSAGDWMYWDTLRGITPAGTDSPYLRLNTTAGQDNSDSLHPAPEGFTLIAGQNANNIDGAEYIYMAIA